MGSNLIELPGPRGWHRVNNWAICSGKVLPATLPEVDTEQQIVRDTTALRARFRTESVLERYMPQADPSFFVSLFERMDAGVESSHLQNWRWRTSAMSSSGLAA